MENKYLFVVTVLIVYLGQSEGEVQKCYACRSRGELGSCKDPFTYNTTQAEHEPGVQVMPCASHWCAKIIESENALKEEYGVATQRMCLQRGPSDEESRCAYTLWNNKRVYMCFCKGNLCNTATPLNASMYLLVAICASFWFFR